MKTALLIAIAMLAAVIAQAADINLAWDAVAASDLAGYRVYKSTTPGTYDKLTGKVCDVSVTTCKVTIIDGTYYFVATAYDKSGNESGFSNEVTAAVDTIAPANPQRLRVTTIVSTN